MGRRKERTGFGRRQVLQLNDSKREDSPYRGQGGSWPVRNEGNALSGLMAHYGESDVSEEEEEETPPHLPAEPPPPDETSEPEPPLPPQKTIENGHSLPAENKGNISLDIDSKVANFLAEIDALDTDKPDDIDGEPMQEVEMEEATPEPLPPPLPEDQTPEDMSEESYSEDSDEEVPDPPEAPAAPVTVWQHCQDENTQYFYYWNTNTNEVTWEIPLEYSQYLLQLKEHDESMARYEAKKAEYEESLKTKTKSSEKKRSKTSKPPSSKEPTPTPKEEETPPHRVEKKDIKPWLLKKIRETYGDKYDTGKSEDEEEEEKPPQSPDPPLPPEIGPQLPSDMVVDSTSHVEIGPQLPPIDHDEDKVTMIGPMPDSSHDVSLPEQTLSSNKGKVSANEDSAFIGPMPPGESVSEKGSKKNGVLQENGITSNEGIGADIDMDDSSEHDNQDDASSASEGDGFIGPQLPVFDKKSLNITEEAEAEEDDLDFIDKQLEEPYMALDDKKKTIKKVQEPLTPPPIVPSKAEEEEDVEFDIDDIDQQLDMALEKKTAEQKTEKDQPTKRKGSIIESDIDKKRSKLSADTNDVPKKKIDKEEIKMKAEVADLSTLITDKLEFLEVTRKGLSKLQILLVETETRISDWREGALSTRYLLGRLQDAELQLQQYESSAAPLGWACHWDRTYKRYFYFHTTTGSSQWDYPEDDNAKHQGKAEASSSSAGDATIVNGKVEAVSSSQTDGEVKDGARPKDPPVPQYSQDTRSSTDGPVAKPSFPVDPSLFQDLFAPAPPPPSEPPPPGVESANHALGPPRPPPGLPNSIPLSRSPPPPPPGTTPPHAVAAGTTATTTAEDPDASEVPTTTMDPTTTSLLAAAPPPPPPPEDVTTPTANQPSDQYTYPAAVVGSAYISNLPSGAPVPLPSSAVVNPSTIMAQPVIAGLVPPPSNSIGGIVNTATPPAPYSVSQPASAQCTPPDTPPRTSQPSYDTSLDGVPLSDTAPSQQAQSTSSPSSSQQVQQQQQAKEKKRKKEKKSSMGLSLKKKKLPSLVAKWQEVHEAVEREVSKHNKDDDSP